MGVVQLPSEGGAALVGEEIPVRCLSRLRDGLRPVGVKGVAKP